MIEGFEEYTQPLSDYEETILLPACIEILSKCKGRGRILKNYQIATKIHQKTGQPAPAGATIRLMINHIRIQGLIIGLIATSKGYYISDDANEIAQYIKGLKQRGTQILRLTNRFELLYRELTQPSLPL